MQEEEGTGGASRQSVLSTRLALQNALGAVLRQASSMY